MGISRSQTAWLALIAVYLIWGTTLAAIRICTDTMPPAWIGAIRFCGSGLLLILLARWQGDIIPHFQALKRELLIGFMLFFAGNSIPYWTVPHLGSGFAALLVATSPFWMLWMSSLMPPKEAITTKHMIGIGVGFTGLAVLLLPELGAGVPHSPYFAISALGALTGVFFWSLGSVMVAKYPSHTGPLMGLGIQNLTAGLCLLPIAGITAPHWDFQSTTDGWLAMVYLSLLGTIFATLCYYHVLKTLSVKIASTFAFVTPVIAVIVGAWLFQEHLSPSIIIGSLIILSGVWLVQSDKKSVSERSEPSSPVISRTEEEESSLCPTPLSCR